MFCLKTVWRVPNGTPVRAKASLGLHEQMPPYGLPDGMNQSGLTRMVDQLGRPFGGILPHGFKPARTLKDRIAD